MKNNPYVGPRPYEKGDRERFFGRDRETLELTALILSEREVLVYAQSGAGKTSLFNAAVIPMLEEEYGYNVLPVARVGSSLPAGLDPAAVPNIFIFSTLLSLAGEGADPAALTGHSLASYLKETLAADLAPLPEGVRRKRPLPILIFDQFEEIFTTHRSRWQEAQAFFDQVREALDGLPKLGVVFAMREEFVAMLDPYLSCFYHRLRSRFRLEPLKADGAFEAIQRPAAGAGHSFEKAVAVKLVNNLRQMKVQEGAAPIGAAPIGTAPIGTAPIDTAHAAVQPADEPDPNQPPLGPFIEPVQLQVVCASLWDSLPDDRQGPITAADVQKYGDVNLALETFYDRAVLAAVSAVGDHQVRERDVRAWFAENLITPAGTRGSVFEEKDQTGGLPNTAVVELDRQHIIRAEVRAGGRWYELSHDRMVDPVVESNRKWQAARETPLRAAARRWDENRDNASLLYHGKALRDAQAQTAASPDDFESFELDFLQESQTREAAARARRRRLVVTAIGAAVLFVAMIALTIWALGNQQEAVRQQAVAETAQAEAESQKGEALAQRAAAVTAESIAHDRQLDAEKAQKDAVIQAQRTRARALMGAARDAVSNNSFRLGLLLGQESVERYRGTGTQSYPDGMQFMSQMLSRTSGVPITSYFFSPNGRWRWVELPNGDLQLSDPAAPDPEAAALVLPGSQVVEWSADSTRLLTSTTNGDVLWDLSDPSAPLSWPITLFDNETADVSQTAVSYYKSYTFSPDGRWLFATQLENRSVPSRAIPPIYWTRLDLTDPQSGIPALSGSWPGGSSPIGNQVNFITRNGRWVIVNKTQMVDMQSPESPWATLVSYEGVEPGIVFSPDQRWMVIDNVWSPTMLLLDLELPDPRAEIRTLENPGGVKFQPYQSRGVFDQYFVSFSPNGRWLMRIQSDDLRVWDLQAPGGPSTAPVMIRNTRMNYSSFDFSSDSCWLVSQSWDGAITFWLLNPDSPGQDFYSLHNPGGEFGFFVFNNRENGGIGSQMYLATRVEKNAFWVFDVSDINQLRPGCSLPPLDQLSNGRFSLRPPEPEAGLLQPVGLIGGLDSIYIGQKDLPRMRWMLASSYNSTRYWDLTHLPESLQPVYPLRVPFDTTFANTPNFSPDGHWFAISGTDRTVAVYDAEAVDQEPVILTDTQGDPLDSFTYLDFDPNGRYITGYSASDLVTWQLDRPGEPIQALRNVLLGSPDFLYNYGDLPPHLAVGYSPDGRWLFAPTQGNPLAFFPINAQGQAGVPFLAETPPDLSYDVTEVVTDAHGKYLAARMIDPDYKVWLALADLSKDSPQWQVFTEMPIDQFWISSTGQWLVTRSPEGKLALQDVQRLISGQPAAVEIPLPDDPAAGGKPNPFVGDDSLGETVFSPDDAWVAVKDGMSSLALIDLSRTRVGEPLPNKTFDPTLDLRLDLPLAASPDGRWLLADSSIGLRLWDMPALLADSLAHPDPDQFSKFLATFHGQVIRFSSDSRWLAIHDNSFPTVWNLTDPFPQPVVLGDTLDTNTTFKTVSIDTWTVGGDSSGGGGGAGDRPNYAFFAPNERLWIIDFTRSQAKGWPLDLQSMNDMICRNFHESLTQEERINYLQGEQPVVMCK